MKAMILAAGRGERMRPLTDSLPKPLIEIGGETLIERHLRRLVSAGVADIVINTGWLGEQIPARLGDGHRYGARIAYSHEGWPALETGGGVRRALPLLGDDPFLLLSADIYCDYPLDALRQRAETLPSGDLAHLVLVPNPDFHPGGDFGLNENGRILAEPRLATFANLSIIRPALFDDTAEGAFPIGPLWRAAASRNQVSGELYHGAWHNLGTPAQVETLNRALGSI